MDIATVAGAFGGGGLVLLVMLMAGNLMMFWDLVSLIIVVGGAAGACVIRMPMSKVMPGMMSGLKAVFVAVDDPVDVINEIIELANTARKNSILALEEVEVKNKFLAKYVRFMVDGYDQEVICSIIDVDVASLKSRHKSGRSFYDAMGEGCPAFGMIGTVIGLIVIMADLSDIDKIGPGLAVALITTLYGALIANLIFMPVSAKMKLRTDEEVVNFSIIKEGVNGILAGDNPRTIKQKLDSFLDPSQTGGEEKAAA